jgi:predicted ATP-dependent serine protease
MKLNHIVSTSFTPVKDVQIPEIYFRRIRSNIPEIDEMFGGGILPGSCTTLSSKAGVGKSTMVLQILDGMSRNGKNVGYISAEESIHQVAFSCRRLGIDDVGICNESKFSKILSFMDGMDLIVIDSFQAMDKGTFDERTAIEKLIEHAKATECAVIIICHLTKGGVMRGSNHLTYAVDVNMFVEMGESADFRRIYFSKNRFGPGIDYTCSFTSRGYDFTAIAANADNSEPKKNKKTERKERDKEEILKLNDRFSVSDICTLLNVDASRAGYLLRELTTEGKLNKNNKRGSSARWWVNKIEAKITKH